VTITTSILYQQDCMSIFLDSEYYLSKSYLEIKTITVHSAQVIIIVQMVFSSMI